MNTDLEALGHDLLLTFGQHTERRRRRKRRTATASLATLAVCALAAAAMASGIASELRLDPTQWSILGSGDVDNGRGEYVIAERRSDGSTSTFLVEHDAGLSPYRAFLLHEQTRAASEASSPVAVEAEQGDLCSPAELTRAENTALMTVKGQASSTTPMADKVAVDAAVQAAFAGSPCKGLDWAGEQARLVYAGVQPASTLMPGVNE
jgi:hypothetical protein